MKGNFLFDVMFTITTKSINTKGIQMINIDEWQILDNTLYMYSAMMNFCIEQIFVELGFVSLLSQQMNMNGFSLYYTVM